MNSKYNYNDVQVPEPKYDTDTANKYYVDKVAKQLSGDIEGDISGISADIATKSKNYTSAPNPPYNVGDTYMNGDDIYICITSRGYGSFTQADWKLASNYDNTQDVIDGGITTTQGTFIVTDSAGTTAAGLTAYGTGNNNVRIWAGSSIGDRNSAPFRVTQGGALYANNATIEGTITSTNANIKGIIKADSGTLGAWTINAYKIYNADAESGNACCIQYPNYEYQSGKFTNWVFAAGATDHTGYGNAKFRVNKAGAMYATSGQIGGWTIGSDSLYGNTSATCFLKNDGTFVLAGPKGQVKFDSATVRINTANKLLFSDRYNESGLPSINDTVAIRAYNGTVHINSSYGVYAGDNLLSGSSSKAIKENIIPITEDYINEIYDAVYNMPYYTYDYKDKYGDKDNIGFVIEDIEDTCLKRVLKINQNKDNKDVKNFGPVDLSKMNLLLIKTLMNKIEVLENKIKEMEESR